MTKRKGYKNRKRGGVSKRTLHLRSLNAGKTPGQMDYAFTRRPTSNPFLTFFHRCYRRPALLTRCLTSVAAQTTQNYDQVFVVDSVGRGILWANQSPHHYRHLVTGKYVYFMDDDFCVNADFISTLKSYCDEHDPDVLVFRVYRVNRYLPMPAHWRRLVAGTELPRRGRFSGDCFIVRRELWQEHVHAFGHPTAGNWAFATVLWAHTSNIHYLNVTLARYRRKRGAGKPERGTSTVQVLDVLRKKYGRELVEQKMEQRT